MKPFVFLVAVIFSIVPLAVVAQHQHHHAAKSQSARNYAPINGMQMYYEVHGSGEPLIILHGAYMTLEGPVRELAQQLAATRRVIITEFQGHGRTNDIDRPITYENLAGDISQLLKHLKIGSADVLGYSLGGGVAMQLAIRYPEQVKRVISLSAPYSYAGIQSDFKPRVPQMIPEMFADSPVRNQYDSLAPDPSKFPELLDKVRTLDMTDFNWENDYARIKKPMMLIFGDADIVTMKHITEMFTRLGGNVMGDLADMPNIRLAVLPYTTHTGVLERWQWIVPMVQEFLAR